MSTETIAYITGSVISGIAALIALYVSYRLLRMKDVLKKEMTDVVKENFAGKEAFDAHEKADLKFQSALTDEIKVKRGEYRDKFDKIFKHIETTEIHQPSMSSLLITEKFDNLKSQIGAVATRVDEVKRLVDHSH